jgi:VWFA-related protein
MQSDHIPVRASFRRLALAAAVLSLLISLPTPRLGAQVQQTAPGTDQERPTFKVEVNNVEVDVTVTGRDGRFVRDLKASDFEVLEDGKPVKINAFTLVDLPVTTTVARSPLSGKPIEIEPDVHSNAHASEGRVYIIVLDDLNTDPLRSGNAKAVARQFLQQYFAPGDIGAVIHTSGRPGAAQEFTTSRRLLLESVEKFIGSKLRSAVLERKERGEIPEPSIQADQRMYRVLDPLEAERAARARNMLDTLKGVNELVNSVRGRRKAVLLVSEGIDYDIENGVAQTASGLTTFTSPAASEVLRHMHDSINAALRSNATIYSVDPRGLATTGDEIIQMGSLEQNPHLGLGPEAFQDELRRAQDTLRTLAEETGGVASVSSNDFSTIFNRVVSDTSTYYMLAYTSPNERRDGRFRKIQVRVNRPGVQVRARKGYAAPSGKTTAAPGLLSVSSEPVPALRDALSTPVATPGLLMRAFAVPFKSGTAPSVVVGIEVEGHRFKFEQKDGVYTDTLHVALGAIDEKGKFHSGDRHTVEMKLKPETYEAVKARGVRLLFRLPLPPGRYQIRAAAHETGAATTGSVYYDLQVPDYKDAKLAVSGMLLTSTAAQLTPTARPDELLGKILAAPPTASREFATNEQIGSYLEMYPSASTTSAGADVTTSLVAPDGKVAFRSEDRISAEELRAAANGYGWLVPIPLSGVAPGNYVLRVEVRSRNKDEAASLREVPLDVRSATGAGQ